MTNNPRWQAWLGMLRQSDQTLTTIATMAALVVLCWELSRRMPDPWRAWARQSFLLAGACITYFVVSGQSANAQDVITIALAAVAWIGIRTWIQPKLSRE